jgi:hypothetical protein
VPDPPPGLVGGVVVVLSPEDPDDWDESDAPDEWAWEGAPLEGTLGRYSSPAGPARAVEASTSETIAASARVAVPRKVTGDVEGAKILA